MKRKIVSLMFTIMCASTILGGCGKKNKEVKEDVSSTQTSIETEEEEKVTFTMETFNSIDTTSTISADYANCATFDDVISKIKTGSAYSKTKLGDKEVLFITDNTFDDNGIKESTSAQIFILKDSKPYYIGKVEAGGTAYPLTINNDTIYACGNHYVNKIKIKNDVLVCTEENFVNYNSDGMAIYFHKTEDKNYEDFDQEISAQYLNSAFSELESGMVINFTVK